MRQKKGPRRWDWLIKIIINNNFTKGAEVGVQNGNNASKVLRRCPAIHLYLVDRWENITPDPNGERVGCENWDAIEGKKRAMRKVHSYKDRVTVLHGSSVDMAKKVEDGSLDIVFIDADHRYSGVKADIEAWTPKVRKGGIVCGHDFDYPDCPGVRKAVEESFTEFEETGINFVWSAKRDDYIEKE